MKRVSSDVAFSPSVKRIQAEKGSRRAYARMERGGGFETEVNDELRAFLAEIDTAFLATASADGQPYVQHRGGPKGFIRALDAHRLGFLDYAGNRQYVSTGNLAENDRIGLFLIDYAKARRVKVWGTARFEEATPERIAELGPQTDRARPEQVMLIELSAWDTNCPQHIPQKIDANEVALLIAGYQDRIRALEAALSGSGR